MATSAQHEALYATLRATVLARHFALGRWFRANMLSLWNVLQEPPPGAMAGLGAADQERVRRWSVATHGRENPLLVSPRSMTSTPAPAWAPRPRTGSTCPPAPRGH